MWREMLAGWIELFRQLAWLLASVALVAFVAWAVFLMLTRGFSG